MIFLAVTRQAGLNATQSLSWVFLAMAGGGMGGIPSFAVLQEASCRGIEHRRRSSGGQCYQQFYLPGSARRVYRCWILMSSPRVSGVFNKVIRWLPREIIMAMIAGVFMRHGTGLITNGMKVPIVCGGAFIAYLLCETYIKHVPRMLGALIGGVIAALLSHAFKVEALHGLSINLPSFFMPAMPTWAAILAISIPLAIISVASEDVQAIGILLSEGYDDTPKGTRVPINVTTTLTGVFSMIVPFFGCHDCTFPAP